MRKPTPAELWEAIDADGAHAERARIEAMSPEDIERDLAAAGFDPEAVRVDADRIAARIEKAPPAVARPGTRSAGGRRVATRAMWLLAAALACAALFVFAWRAAISPSAKIAAPIEPDNATLPPRRVTPPGPSAEDAVSQRTEATRACEVGAWATCLHALDGARAIDPAGDADPEVQRMRRVATQALHGPPIPPGEPKPRRK
jgi:hypothetical protein